MQQAISEEKKNIYDSLRKTPGPLLPGAKYFLYSHEVESKLNILLRENRIGKFVENLKDLI